MALDEGAWKEAQRAFQRALTIDETPEALEGLGLAAWWLDLADVVFDSRERAYRGVGPAAEGHARWDCRSARSCSPFW